MNVSIWNGTSTFTAGTTPFGFYDEDTDFQTDADKVADYCARSLGYPLVDIELQSGSFYTVFEKATTVYGNELYAFQIRDNQLSIMGAPTGSLLNTAIITPNFETTIRLSEMYGAEAGSGGNIPYYSGSIATTSSVQNYDLKEWAVNEGITGSIEIKKVFYQSPPAITKYYDPYSGTGFGFQGLFNSFGFGSMSPAISFLMMPLNYDLQTIQAIELNYTVRKSNYSFQLRDNQLKIFPIPNVGSGHIWFEYIKRNERIESSIDTSQSDSITNVSNAPYVNITYNQINSVGRAWIFEYALALSKEILGYVRGKYTNIPIPNDTITLNQNDLLTDARKEQEFLREKLKIFFDETSRQALLERRTKESDFNLDEIKKVPFVIYLG